MNSRVWKVLAASLIASTPAAAGLNPGAPGLPTVAAAAAPGATYAAAVGNNQMSSMCVDCHTRNPKSVDGTVTGGTGTHYVSVTTNTTNSGGSGVNAAGSHGATRDDGEFFKVGPWDGGGSTGSVGRGKYGNGANSFMAGTITGRAQAMTAATTGVTTAMEIICESCHNIIVNDGKVTGGNGGGGNNLLEAQANNNWQTNAVSKLCVGCHGFMYTAVETVQNADNANWADGRNTKEIGAAGRRGNNEYHWVLGTAYAQNHHVMTGDVIDLTQASVGILWTDNLVVHYSDTCDPASTKGTYPQRATWQNGLVKPAGLSCTNCHTPGHGWGGGPGGSILRNAAYITTPATTWARISDRAAWKRIDDRGFCNQCHE